MMRIAGMALLLAGCAPVAPGPAAAGSECRADAVAGLVGRTLDAATQAAAQRGSDARTIRVIRPGMAVTMDYRTDRLNIDVDAEGRITSVRCG